MCFSPDTQYAKPILNPHSIKTPLEIFGTGYRYETMWEEPQSELWTHRPQNRKGARHSINLNHYNITNQKVEVGSGTCLEELCFQIVLFDYTIPPKIQKHIVWRMNIVINDSDIASISGSATDSLGFTETFSGTHGQFSFERITNNIPNRGTIYC